MQFWKLNPQDATLYIKITKPDGYIITPECSVIHVCENFFNVFSGNRSPGWHNAFPRHQRRKPYSNHFQRYIKIFQPTTSED